MVVLPFVLLLFLCGGPLRAEPSQDASPDPVTQEGAGAPADETSQASDGRRTSRRFFPNFGRNTVGLFSIDNLKPFLAGAAATGVATAFDDNVQRYFGETRRAKWLGDAVDVEGQPVVIVPMALVLFGGSALVASAPTLPRHDVRHRAGHARRSRLLHDPQIRDPAAAARRIGPSLVPLGPHRERLRMGHRGRASLWPEGRSPLLRLLAALVGIGRMEKNVHYLSDVVAGASLGYLVGRTVTRRDGEPLPGEEARPGRAFGPSRGRFRSQGFCRVLKPAWGLE